MSEASEPQSSVLDNVRALQPEIRARAEEIEQARAIPRDLAEKLRTAGVFRRYVPRSHGGDEMWPDEGLTVIEEIARADASLAWTAAVGSEGPSFYAYLPPETYDKIFADGPDIIHSGVINATGKAVRVDGGYRFILVDGLLLLLVRGQIGVKQLRDLAPPLQIRRAALLDIGRPEIDVAVHVLGALAHQLCEVTD